MISPTGSVAVQEALRELKVSQDEDQKINREAANTQFDKKIAELRGQVDILKDQANQIKKMGIFNFVAGLVTTLIGLAGGLLEAVKGVTAATTIKILGSIKGAIEGLQGVLKQYAETDQAKKQAQIKEKEMMAEIYGKFSSDYQALEQEAKQQAHETLQTMREIRRDISEAHESMTQI